MSENMEITNCIFCGSQEYQALYSRIDARYLLDNNVYVMNKCRKCGGLFLSPRVREESISFYYPDMFYYADETTSEIWKREYLKNHLKYRLYLKNLKPGKILDVGCRDGSFIKFLEPFGWQAEGFEYTDQIQNRFNCRIHYRDINQFAKNSFDVITLWAVLEHIYRPNEYIKCLQQMLKPGGYLIIQVPKYNSFTGKFLLHEDVPRHVSAYTSYSLVSYINSFGFCLEKINTRCPVFQSSSRGFLLYYLSKLKGNDQNHSLQLIYRNQYDINSTLYKLDKKASRILDRFLRLADYWGQMTAVFVKEI